MRLAATSSRGAPTSFAPSAQPLDGALRRKCTEIVAQPGHAGRSLIGVAILYLRLRPAMEHSLQQAEYPYKLFACTGFALPAPVSQS
jgi:hypothetical protein